MHIPNTELEHYMKHTKPYNGGNHNSVYYVVNKMSISEEPDVGNSQVRFCEGHASSYVAF